MSHLPLLPAVLTILTAAEALLLALAVIAWRANRPEARLHRGLRAMLGDHPQGAVIAPARGRGIGFDFAAQQLAVAWDDGAWGFLYHLEEVDGVEVVVDGEVAAFAYRGQARPLRDSDMIPTRQVGLRLVFDDLDYPDFFLELWRSHDLHDEPRRDRAEQPTAREALSTATFWRVRLESVLNHPAYSWWEPAPFAARHRLPPAVAKPAFTPKPRSRPQVVADLHAEYHAQAIEARDPPALPVQRWPPGFFDIAPDARRDENVA